MSEEDFLLYIYSDTLLSTFYVNIITFHWTQIKNVILTDDKDEVKTFLMHYNSMRSCSMFTNYNVNYTT